MRLRVEAAPDASGARFPVWHGSADLTARLRTPDHQGVAAEVDPYPYVDAEQMLASRTLLVALDEVQDPHNLGAIIRTAEGAGAGVVIPRHRAAEVTAAVVKASAGATEHAAVARVRNLADFLAAGEEGGASGSTARRPGRRAATPRRTTAIPPASCWVRRGRGWAAGWSSLCDVMVSLPLRGQVESLNVSVSAGILLYEALRQRASEAACRRRQAAERRPRSCGRLESTGPGVGTKAPCPGTRQAGRS